MSEPTCQDRIDNFYDARMTYFREMMEFSLTNRKEAHAEFKAYRLCTDYHGSHEENGVYYPGYFTLQLAWGGPGDEFRFFKDIEFNTYKVEYWFLDWHDSAAITLEGEDLSFFKELIEEFYSEKELMSYVREWRALPTLEEHNESIRKPATL